MNRSESVHEDTMDMETLPVRSSCRNEWIDITANLQAIITEKKISNGFCVLFVPHTTAAVTINEGADPTVKQDILDTLSRLVPPDGSYRHMEGNSDAHVKSSLVGVSILVPISHGRLLLGTWQSVFFCEFDGPRNRKVQVHLTETPIRNAS
jgi:secondary thiamine-phosphate synthase enzyme